MATYSQVCSNVGSFTYGNRFTLYVVLTNRDGDPATNKSVVDYNVYFENTSGGGTFTSRTRLYFALNGGGIEDTTSEITGPRNGSVTVASGSTTIDHNNDGTKSISFHALVQSATFGIKGEISGTFTLNTIPRASSVSGGSGNIDGTTTISISSASTSFTHTLRYAFGSLSGTIATGVGTSYPWRIPTSFYAQIPNDKRGIGTIYCDTYSGSTLVGTKTTSFTATADKETCKPTVSATLIDTNEKTNKLTENANIMIKGKSTGQLVITSAPKNSATIKNVTVNGTNVGTSNSITLNYANVSTDSFDIIATDTREYPSSTVTISPTYVDYVPLTLNIKIFRPQPTGTEIQMTYSGNYFNGSFGAKQNSMGMEWYYRVKGSSTWIKGGIITPTISGNTISEKTISFGTGFNYQTAYEFYIYAQDLLTSFSTIIPVSVGMPVFYWGKDFLDVIGDLRRNGTSTNTLYTHGGTKSNTADSSTLWNDVGSGGLLNKSGLFSINDSTGWYNLINVRHRNGSGDGVQFGMQIAKNLTNINSSMIVRSQSTNNWSSWENLLRAKTLFDNPSGTTGTLQLSESAANFSYLEIFYCDNNNCQHQSIRVDYPNGKQITITSMEPGLPYGDDAIFFRTSAFSISGTSITYKHASYFHFFNTNPLNVYSEKTAYNKIVKVIGYR